MRSKLENSIDAKFEKMGVKPYVYRVMYELGCWYAQSLRPDVVQTRALNRVFSPTIVGNTFENKDLMKRGQIDDDN